MIVSDSDIEQKAFAFRNAVLQLAAVNATTVEVAVVALADVLGIAAAKLDAEGDEYLLADRLHVFCARVEQTYNRARQSGGVIQ